MPRRFVRPLVCRIVGQASPSRPTNYAAPAASPARLRGNQDEAPTRGTKAGVDYSRPALGGVAAAFVTDWSAVGEFSVEHSGIIPGGRYEVQVLARTCRPGQRSELLGAVARGELHLR